MTALSKIQLRRDTTANWGIANPMLSVGEYGFETDTGRFKVGDGSSLWAGLPYQSQLVLSGSRSSPNLIIAASGITVVGVLREYQFVKGNGGPVTITANPQIIAGSVPGQELILQGRDDTNTVTLSDGTGLELNGPCILRNASRIALIWDGTVWGEDARNDI